MASVPKEKEASKASQNYCIVKVTNVDEKGALNRVLRAFSVNKKAEVKDFTVLKVLHCFTCTGPWCKPSRSQHFETSF